MKWVILILLFYSCSHTDKPVVYDNHDLYRRIDSMEAKFRLDAERSKYQLKK